MQIRRVGHRGETCIDEENRKASIHKKRTESTKAMDPE
jgi:hypothetical protein